MLIAAMNARLYISASYNYLLMLSAYLCIIFVGGVTVLLVKCTEVLYVMVAQPALCDVSS